LKKLKINNNFVRVKQIIAVFIISLVFVSGVGFAVTLQDADDDGAIDSIAVESITSMYDYIVSTSDNLTDIINNQLSSGETIFIGTGVHMITANLTVDVGTVDIGGAGENLTIIKVPDGTDLRPFAIGINNHVDYVNIHDFSIDANDDQQTNSLFRRDGLYIGDASNITIERVCVYDTHNKSYYHGEGILASVYSEDVQILHCRVNNSGYDGIGAAGNRILIEGCKVTNPYNRGISTTDSSNYNDGNNITIKNNFIEGGTLPASGIGIGYQSGSSGSNNVIAEGNHIYIHGGSGRRGIVVNARSHNITLKDNFIDGKGFEIGIYINDYSTDVMIIDNHIWDVDQSYKYSIKLENVNETIIRGNSITNSATMHLINVKNFTISENTLTNIIGTGIYLSSSCRHGKILSGNIYDASTSGIDCLGENISISLVFVNKTGLHGIAAPGNNITVSYCNINDIVNRGLTTAGNDNIFNYNIIDNCGDDEIYDNGHRTIVNGCGKNAGDPNSAGDWNGYGERGLEVFDTSNDKFYKHNGTGWMLLN